MKNIKFSFLIIFFLLISNSLSAKIEIKYKIDDKIITNIDIYNEKKYITFLRPSLSKISDEEIIKLAENSVIREIIKRKELDLIYKNEDNSRILNQIKKRLFNFKNVKNEKEFKALLTNKNIKYEIIIEKMKYEFLWNELIYKKFNSLVKIDKKNLETSLLKKLSSNKKYEYNLSELLFEVDENEKIGEKHSEILGYIKKNNFKAASLKFSISESATKGGEIGWVKETLLSKNISNILNKLKKGEMTKPLKYPNGYLIIRINDKKEMKEVTDMDKELSELISFERNRQLNQFSLLYYKKLKQNTKINEY